MLFDEDRPNYVGKPTHFKDKKRYTDATRFIAVGMNTKYFQLLMTGGLEDHRLRDIAATITTDILRKVAHLEYQYQLRDKAEGDKSLPKMNSLGCRYPKLSQQMINILNSHQTAASMIN